MWRYTSVRWRTQSSMMSGSCLNNRGWRSGCGFWSGCRSACGSRAPPWRCPRRTSDQTFCAGVAPSRPSTSRACPWTSSRSASSIPSCWRGSPLAQQPLPPRSPGATRRSRNRNRRWIASTWLGTRRARGRASRACRRRPGGPTSRRRSGRRTWARGCSWPSRRPSATLLAGAFSFSGTIRGARPPSPPRRASWLSRTASRSATCGARSSAASSRCRRSSSIASSRRGDPPRWPARRRTPPARVAARSRRGRSVASPSSSAMRQPTGPCTLAWAPRTRCSRAASGGLRPWRLTSEAGGPCPRT
mmetsp:Transcript_110201/g.351223  ORF Transcript_110201/g.351223 Transcript_110201/m.351223 type:complete len:303 (+) Transcript_110201:1050-1958(+)